MSYSTNLIEQMIESHLCQLEAYAKQIAEKNQAIQRLKDESAELEKSIAEMRADLAKLRSTDS